MSAEENTRLAQSAYEAFGRGDIPALADVMADDIEWMVSGDLGDNPTAGTYRGKDEVLGWFGKLTADLDFSAFEPRDLIAQGDKVVSIVHAEATVRSTGRLVINDEAHVWTIEGGKLARFRIYFDHRSSSRCPPPRVAPPDIPKGHTHTHTWPAPA